MSISFGGIGSVSATFKTTGTINEGDPVKMSSSGTVAAAGEEDRFCGIATYVSDDGYAAVKLKGCVTVPLTGSVSVGYATLLADGDGGVMADEDGAEFLVIETATGNCTIIL